MLFIIVPVHNRIQSTIEFVKSINNQRYKDYKVVVVDDGSTDNTETILNETYPDVVVLKGDGNLFWGGGINKGLDYVCEVANEDDYIAFANNDVKILEDTIVNLFYSIDEIGLYHSLTVNSSDIVVSSGAKINNWLLFSTTHPLRKRNYKDVKNLSKIEIDLMTGRFIIFPKKVLEYYPRIDTINFPHYIGDNDFSLSLKKKRIKCYIVPASKCILDVATTGENPQKLKKVGSIFSSFKSIRSTNNLLYRFRFGKKHCPKHLFLFYLFSMFLQVIILNIIKREV